MLTRIFRILQSSAGISLAAVLTLLLTACGSDNETDSVQPTPTPLNYGKTSTVSVGDDAPNFDLPTATGETVSLANYAGQPVLLFFHMADG